MRPRFWLFFVGAALLGVAGWAAAERLEDRDYTALDNPVFGYRDDAAAQDRVIQLDRKLDKGTVKLDYAANGLGYLPAVLRALDVNLDSQVLVFSKTSTQAAKINPQAPRAIYFNDDVQVGFVRNGDVLEFTALDPVSGVKTYTMDMERAKQPGFGRREDCLLCHMGGITFGVPGLMVASVHPADTQRERHGSSFITDERTPLKERWGGWYVTGKTGTQHHLGNNPNLMDPIHPGPAAGDDTQNVTSLDGRFDLSKYPAVTSDLVALMTLEHQARMTNFLVRIGWDAREGKIDEAALNQEIDEMLTCMLFADEELLHEPVSGVSTFSKTFPARGPKDRQGRSLRDFDLKTRLFRYPLSYMIYSAAFDKLPDAVKQRVAKRLDEILTGKDESKTFARLSSEDRKAILEIVRETKPGLLPAA